MVIIILGSKSDLEWSNQISTHLRVFGITYKIHIASAHKTPLYLLEIIKKYNEGNKPLVYICVAGRSNALGGFVDAQTIHPVINCPPQSSKFAGLDILSSLRMPSGITPLTVLEPDQAACAAAKILGLHDSEIRKKIASFQIKMKEKIIYDDKEVNK